MKYKTEQEEFWAGSFGDEYISRNKSPQLLASNLNFFSRALSQAGKPESLIEFGANIGMNLKAIQLLFPDIRLHAVEINKKAASELAEVIGPSNVYNKSIFDFSAEEKFEVVLIKGVLIHINPDMLEQVYQKLYDASLRFILISEYYNPVPVSVNYRGHSDRLFKRDFAGEMLVKFEDLTLVDYGLCIAKTPLSHKTIRTGFYLKNK